MSQLKLNVFLKLYHFHNAWNGFCHAAWNADVVLQWEYCCPSVKRVICDTMKESFADILISHERPFALILGQEEWLARVTPNWNFGSTGPRWTKIGDFEPTFARSLSAVTLSEKSSVNTNRKPTTCFPMSLRWSTYVACKGAQKCKTAVFQVKLHFT